MNSIFIILSRFPYPIEKGDKLRAFYQIKELSKSYSIHLCCISDTKVEESQINHLKKFCVTIDIIYITKFTILTNLIKAIFTTRPFQVAYFYSSAAQKKINILLEKYHINHIFCQLIRVSEYVKDSKINKTLDYMDAFSKGLERRKNTEIWWKRPLFNWEYIKVKNYEIKIFDYFNNKTIISQQDKEQIKISDPDDIIIIRNGVEFDYYKNSNNKKDIEILFTGNMNYPPNVDAAESIVKNIMPLIWKTNPNIKVMIAGANPAKRVLALSAENVIITGWVEDLRECYWRSKVFLAPMQIGSGLQNKLLEAMSAEIPCITSNLANNALQAIHNKSVLVAKNNQEYADYVLELLSNETLTKEITKNALDFVKINFSWESSTVPLKKLVKG